VNRRCLDATLPDLIVSVRAQGIVAKRFDRRYEPGQRTGAWQKMRINRGQEFVIGGYTVGGRTFDAVVFDYCEGKQLLLSVISRSPAPAPWTISPRNK
jgi:ATP-dependent DNA ligase